MDRSFRTTSRVWGTALVCAGSLVVFASCHKDETSSSTTSQASDGGAATKAVDPDLAKAVAAAGVKAPKDTKHTEGGPPASGIFEPGQADKELAVGATPKVALGTDGGQPRIDLSVTPKVGAKWSASLDLNLQLDPQAPPLPLALKLAVEVTRGKSADSGAPLVLSWRVTDAALSAAARAPGDAAAVFGQLKGSKVEFDLYPNGVVTHPRTDTTKVQSPDVAEIVRSLADVLATLVLPRPASPMGPGAAWMVTNRDPFMGLDLVTYRMAKIDTASPDEAMLSVMIKRYSSSNAFNTPIVKTDAKLTLQELQAPGDVTMHFAKGSLLPTRAQLKMQMAALLSVGGQAGPPGAPGAPQGQQATVQSQTIANLELSPKP